MIVAVHGGSFDPVHVGHLLAGAWVTWTGQAAEVWAVPVSTHPFGKAIVASYAERVAMLETVAATLSWLRVSTIEAELPAPGFSIDTLDALRRRHPQHRFRLMVGADVIPETPRWKDWARIQQEYEPIVVGRHGYSGPPGAVALPAVSASDIRERARRGESIDGLVPALVIDRVRRLYGPRR